MHSLAVSAAGLIDTGAILAIVDARDRWHSDCLEALRSSRPAIYYRSSPHRGIPLSWKNPNDVDKTWRFVRSGALTVLSGRRL